MAHYALLDENNVVVNVIVGKDEDDPIAEDWELEYSRVTGLTAKRTSYNTYAGQHKYGGTPFRKNYAIIGYTYDPIRDAFIPPKPPYNPSYVLDEDTCLWEPPLPCPDDGLPYMWNEEQLAWVRYTIQEE